MRLPLILAGLLVAMMVGCSSLPKDEDPVMVEGVPTVEQLVDSLTQAGAQSIKWAFQDGNVLYAAPGAVNWGQEFKAFLRDNVNKQRFSDAYTIQDSVRLGTRYVDFHANSPDQEIQYMGYAIKHGRLIGLRVEKDRSNLFSSLRQSFVFSGTSYTLTIDQRIPWVFENVQTLHGTIVPHGEVWRAQFNMIEGTMPVLCLMQADHLLIQNSEELIAFTQSGSMHDSLVFRSDFFQSYLILATVSENEMRGRWVNEKRDLASSAKVVLSKGVPYRFNTHATQPAQVAGEHTIIFRDSSGVPTDTALLVLKQNHHQVEGSILTETGDYRYLDGSATGDSLFLSTMDGTHTYLIKAHVSGDKMTGVFYANTSWREAFIVEMNLAHRLKSAEEITQLTPNETFNFSFPDASGRQIQLSDSAFSNKVVLVSIMGTWCSNCLDEALFLKRVQTAFDADDLAIVALDFELVSDSTRAMQNINQHITALNIEYPVLLACTKTTAERARAALPSLQSIRSYPTLIVLNRKHEVVRIHTGFSGPATGEKYYAKFEDEYFGLIRELVAQ